MMAKTARWVSREGEIASTLKMREGDQDLPEVNDCPDVQGAVIADIARRRDVGISRYGTALQPFNGRDALRDLYEELTDALMYIKQLMLEDSEVRERVAVAVAHHCPDATDPVALTNDIVNAVRSVG